MKLLQRSPKPLGEEVTTEGGAAGVVRASAGSTTPSGHTNRWTAGRAIASRLTSLFLVALMLVGGVAGVLAFADVLLRSGESTGPEIIEGHTIEQQQAASYAGAFTAAWLSATRDEPGALATYVSGDVIATLGTTPTQFQQLAVASITPVSDSSVSIALTALVREFDLTGTAEEPASTWVVRAYQVLVQAGDAGFSVVGLPTPIATTPIALTTPTIYYSNIPENDPVYTSVVEFLGAYAAGLGDLARFTSPESDIAAITPPLAAEISVTSVVATDATPSNPVDGDQVHVFVTATLMTVDGRTIPATYTLTLTSRADRWEISSIDLQPFTTP